MQSTLAKRFASQVSQIGHDQAAVRLARALLAIKLARALLAIKTRADVPIWDTDVLLRVSE